MLKCLKMAIGETHKQILQFQYENSTFEIANLTISMLNWQFCRNAWQVHLW